jgi:hypothetical protein
MQLRRSAALFARTSSTRCRKLSAAVIAKSRLAGTSRPTTSPLRAWLQSSWHSQETKTSPVVGYFDIPASSLPSEPLATFGPGLVNPDFYQPVWGLRSRSLNAMALPLCRPPGSGWWGSDGDGLRSAPRAEH